METLKKPQNSANIFRTFHNGLTIIGKSFGVVVMSTVAGTTRHNSTKMGLAKTIDSLNKNADTLDRESGNLKEDVSRHRAYKKALKKQKEYFRKADEAKSTADDFSAKLTKEKEALVEAEITASSTNDSEEEERALNSAMKHRSKVKEYTQRFKKAQQEHRDYKWKAEHMEISDYIDPDFVEAQTPERDDQSLKGREEIVVEDAQTEDSEDSEDTEAMKEREASEEETPPRDEDGKFKSEDTVKNSVDKAFDEEKPRKKGKKRKKSKETA